MLMVAEETQSSDVGFELGACHFATAASQIMV